MMSLATAKRRKLFNALDKGYYREPEENLDFDFMLMRVNQELIETEVAFKNWLQSATEKNKEKLLYEIADLSNFADFMYEMALTEKGV